MKFTDTELDHLERYHLGTLAEEEKSALEARLQTDGAFREEAELFADFFTALRAKEDTALKQMLVEEEARLKAGPTPKRSNRRWLWLAAALLALSAFVFFTVKNLRPKPVQLFAAHFEAYPNALSPIERAGGAKTPTEVAFEAYAHKDFTAAVAAFDRILLERPNDGNLLFYKAVALLGEGNAPAAIPLLLPLANSPQSQFQQQASWYLALGYLKAGDVENCKTWLGIIIGNPSGYKHDEAGVLLKAL